MNRATSMGGVFIAQHMNTAAGQLSVRSFLGSCCNMFAPVRISTDETTLINYPPPNSPNAVSTLRHGRYRFDGNVPNSATVQRAFCLSDTARLGRQGNEIGISREAEARVS